VTATAQVTDLWRDLDRAISDPWTRNQPLTGWSVNLGSAGTLDVRVNRLDVLTERVTITHTPNDPDFEATTTTVGPGLEQAGLAVAVIRYLISLTDL